MAAASTSAPSPAASRSPRLAPPLAPESSTGPSHGSVPAPGSAVTTSFAPAPDRPVLRVIHSHLSTSRRSWQQALPLEWTLPEGLPATPPAARHLRVVAPSPHDPSPSGKPVSHPGAWVARLAPAILEVIAGERPVAQLTRWTARDVLATLTRRHAAARRHPAGRDRAPVRRSTRSVRVHAIAPGIVEACAVVTTGERCRALALRLEIIGRDTAAGPRWLITACEIG